MPSRLLQLLLIFFLLLFAGRSSFSQIPDSVLKNIPKPVLGPNDTIKVPAIIYNGELVPFTVERGLLVTARMSPAAKVKNEAWTRLRNAVYVTYPYARRCGYILNDINAKLAVMDKRQDRKAYIKSREKELKKEFSEPLQHLSVYQGKVLMKLINRQTGNNCYEIIREYKGGLTARLYQTVAFFYNSSLKQPYDPEGEDAAVETFAQEVEHRYGYRSAMGQGSSY